MGNLCFGVAPPPTCHRSNSSEQSPASPSAVVVALPSFNKRPHVNKPTFGLVTEILDGVEVMRLVVQVPEVVFICSLQKIGSFLT